MACAIADRRRQQQQSAVRGVRLQVRRVDGKRRAVAQRTDRAAERFAGRGEERPCRGDVRREVRQLIRDVGITAIIVTHDQEEALSLAGEVALMMEGRILQTGTPGEIYSRPASRAVGEFLGAANFLRGDVHDGVVDTPLGLLPVSASFRGAVDAMVRAEDLAMAETGGAPAEVLDIDYYGHDQMVTARLDTGEVVRIRTLTTPVTVGRRIGVVVKGECFVFPREAS